MSQPPDPDRPPPTPTWVKVCGALFAAFVVVFVGLHLAGLHLAGQGFRHHGQPAAQGTPAP
jgi:hypothetical protein